MKHFSLLPLVAFLFPVFAHAVESKKLLSSKTQAVQLEKRLEFKPYAWQTGQPTPSTVYIGGSSCDSNMFTVSPGTYVGITNVIQTSDLFFNVNGKWFKDGALARAFVRASEEELSQSNAEFRVLLAKEADLTQSGVPYSVAQPGPWQEIRVNKREMIGEHASVLASAFRSTHTSSSKPSKLTIRVSIGSRGAVACTREIDPNVNTSARAALLQDMQSLGILFQK